MATKTTEQGTEQGTERDATATGAGRKTTCKHGTANGPCVLWLNHEGPHDAGLFSDDELTESVPTEAEIAETSAAERDALQVQFDERIARNWTEFKNAGSDKPQWRKVEVRAAMSEMIQRKIRNAADYHNPPVGVRIDASFVPGGKVKILYAAVTRRKYNRQAS